MFAEHDPRALWQLLQALQAETYGPRARELQARRECDTERTSELSRRLDAADKRVAAYEAERRAGTGQAKANTDDAG